MVSPLSRLSLCLVSVALAGGAFAQTPDVSIVTDIRFSAQFADGKSQARFYDAFGRHSTVTLQLVLEGVFLVRISERFARISGDTMGNQLEFATFELPGMWRFGFIDAPFGQNWLIRDYGFGGELRTNLLLDNLPIVIAALDDGERRTRGVIGRAGGRIGFSFATGNHFAASGTSLTAIRRPEDAPGIGRGYKLLLGADIGGSLGPWTGKLEVLSLRRGQTNLDPDEDVVDAEIRYRKSYELPEFRIGIARALKEGTNHGRFEAEVPLDMKVSFTGQLRVDKRATVYAIGLRARF